MISEVQKKVIVEKLYPFNPAMIGIFGSYARNEQTGKSDMDILVEFNKTVNLLDIIGIENALSESLGVKVDLVTSKFVHSYLAPHIKEDFQVIYHAEK